MQMLAASAERHIRWREQNPDIEILDLAYRDINKNTLDVLRGVVQKLKAELDFECAVIATGGLSSLIADHAATIERVEQDLTLEGLRLIYERNRPGR
jgi:type III pantothenate kinase